MTEVHYFCIILFVRSLETFTVIIKTPVFFRTLNFNSSTKTLMQVLNNNLGFPDERWTWIWTTLLNVGQEASYILIWSFGLGLHWVCDTIDRLSSFSCLLLLALWRFIFFRNDSGLMYLSLKCPDIALGSWVCKIKSDTTGGKVRRQIEFEKDDAT